MTGWGVRYRCTFMDFNGHTWRTDILLENYTGATEEVGGGGRPAEINTLGEGDSEAGIKPKEWLIEFNNLTSFQFMSMFTGTARDYLMELYKDGVLIGTGWVDPDNYSEEFTCEIYPSMIHCHDGLGELKNKYFIPNYPTGSYLRSALSYLYYALQETGLDLPIYVATDITFSKKTGAEVLSQIFEELYIDWRIFRTGENTYFSYYDIITYILNSFEGHRLFQESGAWWIERAGAMKASQYDVDQYISGEYAGSVKKTSIQPLTSNSVAQVVRFGSDAELTIVPGWKRFTITHEFGVRNNILKFFNLEGEFYSDEWRTDNDLWSWTRNDISIVKDDNSAVRIPGFIMDPTFWPPYMKSLQADMVQIIGKEDIEKLRMSWGSTPWDNTTGIGMKLTITYMIKKGSYFPDSETLKMYARVVLKDSFGGCWNAYNNYTDPVTGEHTIEDKAAWFNPHGDDPNVIIEIDPVVNEWSVAEFTIGHVALRDIPLPYEPEWWGFYVKLYPVLSSLGEGDPEIEGLVIKSVALGWYDRGNREGTRTLVEVVNEKNRYVPSDLEVYFGETLGHWGKKLPKAGQQWMDKYIFQDASGDPVTVFGTKSAGLGAGLIAGIMRDTLTLKHNLPLFKLRGSLRDNPNTMDFCSMLQDYDGRKYNPTGMSRDAGMCELQAEWIQVREPEMEAGGEFNWDFSNDFNIGST